MKQVNVLIVVDCENALSTGPTGGLPNNVYMIDNNRYFGSGAEGNMELVTACSQYQTINWRVEGVSQSNDVEITGFTTLMPTMPFTAEKISDQGDTYWTAKANMAGTKLQYSVSLSLDGTVLSFDPFLNVTAD